MFKHLLKLIWNRKSKNALLIIEIFLSFIVFFAVLTFAIYNFNNYRKPLGYNYDDISVLSINWGQMEKAQAWEKSRQMQEQLSQFPEVENIALT
ncbi:MAG: putative ABC transport system permease protein, partial [Bacteroidia bacterium]